MLEDDNTENEFLIIGSGLAAWVLAHTLYSKAINFKIIGNSNLSSCSHVAAGIWNPIVFKRFTKSWLANELISELLSFYKKAEQQTSSTFLTERNIIKLFYEEQEKTLWQKKEQAELHTFLNPNFISTNNLNFQNAMLTREVGIVERSGNLDVSKFINTSKLFFNKLYTEETVDYKQLAINENFVSYKNKTYSNIIFAEGHLVKHNPFFNFIPLNPAKGELLHIEHNSLNIQNYILNKDCFVFNAHTNNFIIGATYNWSELNDTPTEKAKTELLTKFNFLVTNNYKVLQQKAGVRPASIDRRPIVGQHPKHKNLWVFNGLGTKGVMLAPFFAKQLINFYLNKEMLNLEVDVKRFYNQYERR